MIWVPIAFLTAAIFAAVATPMVSRLALAFGVIDRPSERKVNQRDNIPLLGGMAVAVGLIAGLSAVLLLHPTPGEVARPIEGLLTGGFLVLAVGVVDDRWGLGAWPKLTVQIAAAAIAFQMGYRIDHITNPVTAEVYGFSVWFSWLVTTGWIVIVTNSVNLIDGLDGLCTGVAAIIAATLTIIAWQAGNIPGVALGVTLVGALVGFLPYNFPPARMFLGDTGALFIGFSLSILALEGYAQVTLLTFLVPLLALAVPLLDTGLSIIRRIRHRSHIMQADKMHLHHRLLKEYAGSHRRAVLSIYFLTACFCLIAVSFTRLEGYAVIVFLAVIVLLTFRIVRNLGVMDGGASDDGNPADPAKESR